MDTLPPAPPLTPDDPSPGHSTAPVSVPQPLVFTDVPPVVVDSSANARRDANLAIPFQWGHRDLYPFTPFREDWWNILRERDGTPPWDQLIEKAVSGNQRLLRPDAVKVLWLCSHGLPQGFKHQFANVAHLVDLRREHDLWLDLIYAWGDEHVPNELSITAVLLFFDILKRARLNRAVPVASGGGPGE